MWERLRRFRALDRESRRIFFRAAALLPAISISLRLRGFQATQNSLLGHTRRLNASSQDEPTRVASESARRQMAVRMVNAAVRNVWRYATCLEKSLVLCRLLTRQGLRPQIRIGARTVNGRFEAHAWVEHNGMGINEPEDAHKHYAVFDAAFPLPTSEPS